MRSSNRTTGRRLRSSALLIGAVILAAMPRAGAGPPANPPAVTPTPDGAPSAEAGSPPVATGRKPTGRIRGTVFDPARKAQAGLLVTLSSHSEPDILRVTGTNDKGQYLFQELPPGVYDLKVQAEGFQDAGKESIEVRPPFQNIVDVRLQGRPPIKPPEGGGPAAPAGAATPEGAAAGQDASGPAPVTVRGRFVDQDRRPLVDVSVVLSSLQGKGIHQAFSGDDGIFEIPGVIPGRYRVIVRSPGHVPLDLRSVEILGKIGLTVSLMLVDYPLDFKAGQESATPIEEPRPAPASPAAEGGAPANAARDGAPAAQDDAAADRPGG